MDEDEIVEDERCTVTIWDTATGNPSIQFQGASPSVLLEVSSGWMARIAMQQALDGLVASAGPISDDGCKVSPFLESQEEKGTE